MIRSISIVIPLYNEENNLAPLCEQLSCVMNQLKLESEVIFVDDGSIDASFACLDNIINGDNRFKALRFGRNFGQTAAMAAGIVESSGDVIILMDADLQNDPLDIPLLLNKINEGYDVVSGWRYYRKDSFAKKMSSMLANKLISKVTGVVLHDYGCSLKAYRSEILKNIRLYGEMHRFIPALASITGAKICEIQVNHNPRISGKSNYGMERVGKVIMDLITVKFLLSYLTKPNYIFGKWAAYLFISAILLVSICIPLGIQRAGLMGGIMILAGLQLISMGLLSELMVRIYYESQNKPTYFIKERKNFKNLGK
ncbi:MAG: glycosyltransferase family 2 protein [Desulfobacterales bacterium]|nr:glycosyltransferase family 2 protein [Desulfobacterales bacterium]